VSFRGWTVEWQNALGGCFTVDCHFWASFFKWLSHLLSQADTYTIIIPAFCCYSPLYIWFCNSFLKDTFLVTSPFLHFFFLNRIACVRSAFSHFFLLHTLGLFWFILFVFFVCAMSGKSCTFVLRPYPFFGFLLCP